MLKDMSLLDLYAEGDYVPQAGRGRAIRAAFQKLAAPKSQPGKYIPLKERLPELELMPGDPPKGDAPIVPFKNVPGSYVETPDADVEQEFELQEGSEPVSPAWLGSLEQERQRNTTSLPAPDPLVNPRSRGALPEGESALENIDPMKGTGNIPPLKEIDLELEGAKNYYKSLDGTEKKRFDRLMQIHGTDLPATAEKHKLEIEDREKHPWRNPKKKTLRDKLYDVGDKLGLNKELF